MRNIQEKQPFIGLALVLVLSLAGCSGSSAILDGSHGRPVTDEVTEALQQVVLPTVNRLAAFSPVNQPAPPRLAAHDSRGSVCARFDPLCRSGRYEVCHAESPGAVVFRYTNCERSSGSLDGAWELAQDGLVADALFDLTLDDLHLSGRIGYVLDDMCWRKEFKSFTAARGDYRATFDGSVEYCFTTGAGTGTLRLSIAGPSEPFGMSLELDAGHGDAVVVRGAVTTVCRFDSVHGHAECEGD